MEVSGQLHAPAALSLGTHWWDPQPAGRFERKDLLPLPESEPRIAKPVAWSLYRLSHSDFKNS